MFLEKVGGFRTIVIQRHRTASHLKPLAFPLARFVVVLFFLLARAPTRYSSGARRSSGSFHLPVFTWLFVSSGPGPLPAFPSGCALPGALSRFFLTWP